MGYKTIYIRIYVFTNRDTYDYVCKNTDTHIYVLTNTNTHIYVFTYTDTHIYVFTKTMIMESVKSPKRRVVLLVET